MAVWGPLGVLLPFLRSLQRQSLSQDSDFQESVLVPCITVYSWATSSARGSMNTVRDVSTAIHFLRTNLTHIMKSPQCHVWEFCCHLPRRESLAEEHGDVYTRAAHKSVINHLSNTKFFLSNGPCNTAKQSQEYKATPRGTVTMRMTFSLQQNGRGSAIKIILRKPATSCTNCAYSFVNGQMPL